VISVLELLWVVGNIISPVDEFIWPHNGKKLQLVIVKISPYLIVYVSFGKIIPGLQQIEILSTAIISLII
jgi:hypothetical protein